MPDTLNVTTAELGSFTFAQRSADRMILVACHEDSDIYQVATRFKEFLLAVGFPAPLVEDVVSERVEDLAYGLGLPNQPLDNPVPAPDPCCTRSAQEDRDEYCAFCGHHLG